MKPLNITGLFGALLAVLGPGCAHENHSANTPGLMRTATAPEDRDFLGSFNDSKGNNFNGWWGPYSSSECPVDMTIECEQEADASVTAPGVEDPGTVTKHAGMDRMALITGAATCTYTVYLDGSFRGEVGSALHVKQDAALKAWWIPVWPIVYANRVKVGATGTQFFVHVAGDRHTIGRLKGGTGTLYVSPTDNSAMTMTIQPKQNKDQYVVYVTGQEMGAPLQPTPGSPEEAMFAEVRRRSDLHQSNYPPTPVSRSDP